MASDYLQKRAISPATDGLSTPMTSQFTNTPVAPRSNALSSKVSSLLSASYADLEIRDALNLIDERNIENNAGTRRQLRLDVQREVIESNGAVIREFGHVAEVRASPTGHLMHLADHLIATQTHWCYHCKSK